ncbi:MAG: hypothetical protein GY782_06800 [Gammaproteobacteria bacterium]|nr:hypothetical protein [Gammaproteobacteria bacterium]
MTELNYKEMRDHVLKGYLSDLKKVDEERGLRLLEELSKISEWDDRRLEIEYESRVAF